MGYEQATRLTQPQEAVPLSADIAQYCPGYFLGTAFGMWGNSVAPLEGGITPRIEHGLVGYGGNGTNKCAVVPWQGINLNTRPKMTWVLVYKKNATGIATGTIAGFGATGGSTGNTLFRFVGGVDSANAVRIQAQDSYGSVFFNIDSSDFGADDLRYHCVVVSGAVDRLGDGGGLQYYADGRKLNFAPSQNGYGPPESTLFNIATLLCARRGGAISGADSNSDVALFVPLFGIRQTDDWCQEISRNPWQLFEPEKTWVHYPTTSGLDYTLSAGGSVNFSGSSFLLREKVLSAGGSVSFSGSALFRRERALSSGGSVTFSGSAPFSSSAQYTLSAGGSVNLSGTGIILRQKILNSGGQVTFAGSTPLLFIPAGGGGTSERPYRFISIGLGSDGKLS